MSKLIGGAVDRQAAIGGAGAVLRLPEQRAFHQVAGKQGQAVGVGTA